MRKPSGIIPLSATEAMFARLTQSQATAAAPITDKEKVLAKWPDATLHRSIQSDKFQVWNLFDTTTDLLGEGNTEPEAWADAVRRLEGGK